jgi:hypothetical protein
MDNSNEIEEIKIETENHPSHTFTANSNDHPSPTENITKAHHDPIYPEPIEHLYHTPTSIDRSNLNNHQNTPESESQKPLAHAPANPATIILQWLTYAFWGWTVSILSILIYVDIIQLFNQSSTANVSYYLCAALLILFPAALTCDSYYSKREPEKKEHAAMAVLVVHAVLFAIIAVASLLFASFSLVSVFVAKPERAFWDATFASLIFAVVLFSATFLRTLSPAQYKWIPKIYKIFVTITVIIFVILGFWRLDAISSASGEQVNTQGMRRPSQYTHICETNDGTDYYSQGKPPCLPGDTLFTAETGPQPGTAFSSPCKTTSGPTRYVYISNDEFCPSGTTLVFYNNLGGIPDSPVLSE